MFIYICPDRGLDVGRLGRRAGPGGRKSRKVGVVRGIDAGVRFGGPRTVSGPQHGPNLSPCWSHFVHFLGHFWVFFWHINLRSISRRVFVDFWWLFDAPDPQKHSPCRWIWGYLHMLHDRSWNRSWTDFNSILDPKIAPKSVPRGSRKVLEIMVVFACLREPPKIDFLANMDPTWTQLGP